MYNFPKQTIYQVDAFTNEIFKGNPAAVMIVDELPSNEYMQNVAMEMNLSETVFVCPSKNSFLIRYFTPIAEIPLAGHPTLAAAHILYEIGMVPRIATITFEAKAANLIVTCTDDQIVMQLPKYALKRISPHPSLKKLVGFEAVDMFASDYGWKIAVAQNEKAIADADPDFVGLMKNNLGHLMITAESDSADQDFVVRCFAPALGVNEDPVTGSAHCALVPLWAARLNKTALKSKQISRRTGNLALKLIDDKVEIKGQAVTVFEAQLR